MTTHICRHIYDHAYMITHILVHVRLHGAENSTISACIVVLFVLNEKFDGSEIFTSRVHVQSLQFRCGVRTSAL